jgi:SAM-dependent methyltransferase
VRPGPTDEALDWLVPAGCRVAVDLAAGTGLFTRGLARRVAEVIAVEPDERMRAVLAARSPGVRAVAGRGEDIPVPDASADGVFVSSAWHWLDPELAGPEIARVLRDGGRLGVIWSSRDRRVDWVAELERHAAERERRESERRRRHEVTLPDGAPFENVARTAFEFTRTMTVNDAVDWLTTYSGFLIAPKEEQQTQLSHARALLSGRADRDGTVEIPMRASCWRADRVKR